jgi:DNA-binding transcriptional regulator GbsR (MarR family)
MLSTPNELHEAAIDSADPLTDHVEINDRVLEACDAIGEFIEYWGFKATHGRVWLLLAINKEPVAQKALGEMLSLSRGTISTVVADLVDHGLIKAVSDHRNAPYVAVTDFWPTISTVLRRREWRLINGAYTALAALADTLEHAAEEGGETPYDLERIRNLINAAEMAQRVLNLLINLPMPAQSDRVKGWFDTVSRIARRLRRSAGQ